MTGLRLHLLRNSEGIGNWETSQTAAAPAATQGTTSTGSPLAATTIEGLRLGDAEISYDDSKSKSRWHIQKLNATIGAIGSGRRVPLNLQVVIDHGSVQSSAAVALKATLQARSDAQAFDVDTLAIDATLTDPALPTGGLPVSLSMPHLQYSSAQGSLDIPAFVLASQTLQLSGSLSGKQLGATPMLLGSLGLRPIDLRSWIGNLGIAAPATRDAQVLGNVAGHVTYAMNTVG